MSEQKPKYAPTASVFARVALLIYTLLIGYASWYPFSGWHSVGVTPQAYLTAPWPHYWIKFDVAINVVGYLPWGMLAVFALFPRLRSGRAFVLATVAGIVLSATMEAVQTFLPSRVASNVDLLANGVGCALGALMGWLLTPTFLEQSRLLLLRHRWFSRQASRGLIVIALWPLAQIYPQSYLFGHGQMVPVLSAWFSHWLGMPIDLGAALRYGKELGVEQYWLAEAIITACGLCGALLTLLSMLRHHAPKLVLALTLLAVGVTAKVLASALLLSPENAFAWITPGAQSGLLCGLVMLSGLVLAPALAQRRAAALTLSISVLVINVVPANPYFISMLQGWSQGKFLNFYGAAQFLSLWWPFVALWFLFHPAHRQQ